MKSRTARSETEAEQEAEDLLHAAFHEAGHAVIGRVLGLPCGSATIVPNPDENEAGHSITADDWVTAEHWEERGKFRGDQARSIHRGHILALRAGAEAEAVLLGRCLGGDGDDRYWIECWADSDGFNNEKWKLYEPRMRRHTRRLIRKHRVKVERVAQALLKHQTLSGEAIGRLMSTS